MPVSYFFVNVAFWGDEAACLILGAPAVAVNIFGLQFNICILAVVGNYDPAERRSEPRPNKVDFRCLRSIVAVHEPDFKQRTFAQAAFDPHLGFKKADKAECQSQNEDNCDYVIQHFGHRSIILVQTLAVYFLVTVRFGKLFRVKQPEPLG